MLVNQRTLTIKRGHVNEAVTLLKESFAKLNPPVPNRILVASIAPFEQLIYETQHEDMAAYQQDWDRITGAPWFEETLKKWHSLVEPGGTNYIWSVVSD